MTATLETAPGETEPDLRGSVAPVHPLREFWYYFSENTGAVIGLVTVVTIVLVAISADLIAPHAPTEQYREYFLLPPAWLEGGNWSFVLGTDAVGRDMLSRLMHGSRYSLFVGVMERVREFGIMIAIGFSPARIFGLVMFESLWLGLVGLAGAAVVTSWPYYYLATTGIDISEQLDISNSEIAGVAVSALMNVSIYPENLAIIGGAALLASACML